jgi:hypothetical protein
MDCRAIHHALLLGVRHDVLGSGDRARAIDGIAEATANFAKLASGRCPTGA